MEFLAQKISVSVIFKSIANSGIRRLEQWREKKALMWGHTPLPKITTISFPVKVKFGSFSWHVKDLQYMTTLERHSLISCHSLNY